MFKSRLYSEAMDPRAKIVATLGPATSSEASLKRLLKAGVDVVRLNLSHGNSGEHRRTVRQVRKLSAELNRHIPVILDLMGPRYRLEVLERQRTLKRREKVVIGAAGDGVDLPIDPKLLAHLRPRERFLIDNGLLELRVDKKRGRKLYATVVTGGVISSRKGINLPDSDLPFAISKKDRADIRLAVEVDADYLAASYVGTAADLTALRKVVQKSGGRIPLIAKLERARAMKHLHEIVSSADAVMVARGDLGVEVPLHRVPVLQKQIIESGRVHGKPVIVATQMLESMVERPRPTRAESSDVANAVFDGADALMLSGETAAGRYPIEAVKTMARIIHEAEVYQEPSRRQRREIRPLAHTGEVESRFAIADVVAAGAVFSASNLKLRQIVAFSQGGFTAQMIARYRPETPICMLTPDPAVARRVQLVWGVRPLLLNEEVAHHDEVVHLVDRELRAAKLAKVGDVVVILMGDPIRDKPPTNLMRVHRVRSGR